MHLRSSNSAPGLWLYTYSSDSVAGVNRLDSLTTEGSPTASLTPASFLELRPDGSYTKDFGRFEYGIWMLKDNRLYLTGQTHETLIYPFTHVGDDVQLSIEKHLLAHFENHPLAGSSTHADPFSKENNRWRIPADKKETDPEIKARLLNHCKFWEAYFTWALNDELSSVDVRSTPTLLKIYGNGFTLKPFKDLPGEWKSFFFDAADCQKANDQMEDLFRNHTIAWAHTDNKYKLFIGAFQQMEQALR
jgi:hypothetical protein